MQSGYGALSKLCALCITSFTAAAPTLSTIFSRSQKDLSHNIVKNLKDWEATHVQLKKRKLHQTPILKQHSRSVDFILINPKKSIK
ncbi:hypothetical protein V8B55DRAFT_1292415, partial [Mucor lusitanicus]